MSRAASINFLDPGFLKWQGLRQRPAKLAVENHRSDEQFNADKLGPIDSANLERLERRYKSYLKFSAWMRERNPSVDLSRLTDEAYVPFLNEYSDEQRIIRARKLREFAERRKETDIAEEALEEAHEKAKVLQSVVRGFRARLNHKKRIEELERKSIASDGDYRSVSSWDSTPSTGRSISDTSGESDTDTGISDDSSPRPTRRDPSHVMFVPGNLPETRDVAARKLQKWMRERYFKNVPLDKAVEVMKKKRPSSLHSNDGDRSDAGSIHSIDGDGGDAGAGAGRGLGVKGNVDAINLENLRHAFNQMSQGEWPRRVSYTQYKNEVSYLNNAGQAFPDDYKLRPIIGPNGAIERFEEVGKTNYTGLQDKFVEGIRGDISHAYENMPEKFRPRPLADYAAENATDNILLNSLGDSYAQYYSSADLQRHVANATKFYADPANALNSEDDFRKTYVRLYDHGQQRDCEITVTSQGVTMAFIEPGIINDRYEKKFSEFCNKVAEDLGNGQVVTNGEKMMYTAMQKLGIEPLSPAAYKDALDKMPDDAARNKFKTEYDGKVSEAQRLVRSWSREHVMAEIQKETQVAMAYQRAQQPTLEDYRSIARALGEKPKHRMSAYELELEKADKATTKVEGGSLSAFNQAKFALLNTANPVCVNPGVAFGYSSVSESHVKILFNYQPDMTGAMRSTLTTAYVHLPGTNECYVKIEYFPNTGEIRIDKNTFHHAVFDDKGNKTYTPLPLGKSVPGTSARYIKEVYEGMVIQATAQNGPDRSMMIMDGKGMRITKDLGKVAVMDEKKEIVVFTKRLKPAKGQDAEAFKVTPWDPQFVFMKCPNLGLVESEDFIQERYGLTKDEAQELVARRSNVFIKTSIATKDGYVLLNDGKTIYVKEGETYAHPLPYLDAQGTKLCEKANDRKVGLGPEFMEKFLQIKPSCKIVNEFEIAERKLRELCRTYTGSAEKKAELEKAIKTLKEHFSEFPFYEKINLNAKDETTGKTMMHYAAENVNIPTDLIQELMNLRPDPARELREACAVNPADAAKIKVMLDEFDRYFQIHPDKKFDFSVQGADGKTLLDYAKDPNPENPTIDAALRSRMATMIETKSLKSGIDFSSRSNEFNRTSLGVVRRNVKSLLEFTGHDKRLAEAKRDWHNLFGNNHGHVLLEGIFAPWRTKSFDRALLKDKRDYENRQDKTDQPFMAQNSGHTASSQAREAGRLDLAHTLQDKEIESMLVNITAEIAALKQSKTHYVKYVTDLDSARKQALADESNPLAKGTMDKLSRDNLYQLVKTDTRDILWAINGMPAMTGSGVIKPGYMQVVDESITELKKIEEALKAQKIVIDQSWAGLSGKNIDKTKREELKSVSQTLREFQNKIDAAVKPVEKAEDKIDEKMEFVKERMQKFGVQTKPNPTPDPSQPLHLTRFTDMVKELPNRGGSVLGG